MLFYGILPPPPSPLYFKPGHQNIIRTFIAHHDIASQVIEIPAILDLSVDKVKLELSQRCVTSHVKRKAKSLPRRRSKTGYVAASIFQ